MRFIVSEVPLYPFSGEGGIFDPQQVKGPTDQLKLERVSLQVYLAHKRTPTPYDSPRTLGVDLR